jgi:hypothetical protein
MGIQKTVMKCRHTVIPFIIQFRIRPFSLLPLTRDYLASFQVSRESHSALTVRLKPDEFTTNWTTLIDPSRRKKKIEKGRKNKGEKRNTNIDEKIGNAKHERERIHNLS